MVAADALEQADLEDELHAAGEANGRSLTTASASAGRTIRSGLGAGLQAAIDLDADERDGTRA